MAAPSRGHGRGRRHGGARDLARPRPAGRSRNVVPQGVVHRELPGALRAGPVADPAEPAGEAERLYQRAAGVDPKGLLELADFYDRQGREPDAERCYRQAAESGERSGYIRLGLWLLDHQRPRQETCPWLRKAAKEGYNGFFSKREARARRLALAGAGEEALRWLVDSRALIDDFRRGGMTEEAAAVARIAQFYDENRHPDAENWYRRLAEAEPAAGPVALGDWLARDGRVEQAVPQFKKAAAAPGH